VVLPRTTPLPRVAQRFSVLPATGFHEHDPNRFKSGRYTLGQPDAMQAVGEAIPGIVRRSVPALGVRTRGQQSIRSSVFRIPEVSHTLVLYWMRSLVNRCIAALSATGPKVNVQVRIIVRLTDGSSLKPA